MKLWTLIKACGNFLLFAISGYEIAEVGFAHKEVQNFDEKLNELKQEVKVMAKDYFTSLASTDDLKIALMAICGAVFLLLVWLVATKVYTNIRRNAKRSAKRDLNIKP